MSCQKSGQSRHLDSGIKPRPKKKSEKQQHSNTTLTSTALRLDNGTSNQVLTDWTDSSPLTKGDTMAHEAKAPGVTFSATRRRTVDRHTSRQRTIILHFSHAQEEQFIHVKFAGQPEHHAIDIRGLTDPRTGRVERDVFEAQVRGYCSGLSDLGLQAVFSDSVRSVRA